MAVGIILRGVALTGRGVAMSGFRMAARGGGSNLAALDAALSAVMNKARGPNLVIGVGVDANSALASLGIRLARIGNMRPVWEFIRDDFARQMGTVFKKRGAISGYQAWAPLSPATIRRKAAAGGTIRRNKNRILVATGELRESLTDPNSARFVYKANSRSMIIGTSDPKAAFHDEGNDNLPKRTLIRITRQRKKRWNSKILRHLVNTKQFGFERLR